MKHRITLVVLIIIVLLMGCALYPTSVPATLYTVENLPAPTYVKVKQLILDYSRAAKASGIVVRGDADPRGTIALYCHDVPVLLVSDGPGATSLMVYLDATKRVPSITSTVNAVIEQMGGVGRVSIRENTNKVEGLSRFILKTRDGIDLDATCE